MMGSITRSAGTNLVNAPDDPPTFCSGSVYAGTLEFLAPTSPTVGILHFRSHTNGIVKQVRAVPNGALRRRMVAVAAYVYGYDRRDR
jgi:hypothetical protein